MLIETFQEQGVVSDYVAILSDPDVEVRGLGIAAMSKYQIHDAVCCLGRSLVEGESTERRAAIRRTEELLGWKGLPTYVALLYDSDLGVASQAASAFRSCKKEDVTPHLLLYLKQHGSRRRKKVVTKRVIRTLCELYGEPQPSDDDLKKSVRMWKERLKKELASSFVSD